MKFECVFLVMGIDLCGMLLWWIIVVSGVNVSFLILWVVELKK